MANGPSQHRGVTFVHALSQTATNWAFECLGSGMETCSEAHFRTRATRTNPPYWMNGVFECAGSRHLFSLYCGLSAHPPRPTFFLSHIMKYHSCFTACILDIGVESSEHP
jgi:hypothetical protein